MIRKILLLAFIIFSTVSFGQFGQGPIGHLTIFSEDGDKFTLILNGEIINDIPQTNLRVEDLNQPYYNAKIKFEDQTLSEISKNSLMITDVNGVFSDVTYKIRRDKNNKSKLKMNFFSMIPVQQNFVPSSNVFVVHYGQPKQVVVSQPVGGITQTTTTTSQTTGTNVGVGVSIGGVNMGISINDSIGGNVVTQTTTTTQTGTISSTSVQSQQATIQSNHGCSGYSCMSPRDFNAALSTIESQNFEDTQLKTAKQVISANCLNVDQIIKIANLFNFEDNKLEFAKFAYDYCIEPRNYFKLNGIFTFSSNVDSLSDYIQSRN